MNQDTIRKSVEDAWLSRAKTRNYGKRTSMKYLNAELEFFVGAMAALQAVQPGELDKLSPLVPPAWVFNPMTGRNIVEVK